MVIDHGQEIIDKLKADSKNGEYWKKVFKWFENLEPDDNGIKYAQESLFTDKYMQSIWFYKGIIKFMLYLYRSKNDKDFWYEYSSARVNKITEWYHLYILTQGTFAGKPFILELPQVYIFSKIYGFSRKKAFTKEEEKDKGILFPVNRAWLGATRKNGKSELFAGLGVFIQQNPFMNDARPEIYASGPVQDASDIIWSKGQFLAKSNPDIMGLYRKINTRRFTTHADGTFSKLPFEKNAIEGKNPSIGIITEYHLHPTDEVVESFESAMNMSRINSLILFDTTKGEGIFGVAYNREHQYKELIQDQLDSPLETIGANIATFFWELDDKDNYDWFLNDYETNVFRKSTPMIGRIISLDGLIQEWLIAKKDPLKRREFLIKKGGKWVGNKQSLFMLDDIVETNEKYRNKYNLDELAKNQSECIISIDLAQSGDLNAVTLIFKDEENNEEVPICYSHCFIPADTMEERVVRERKPYHKWVEDGYISLSGKKAVDYAQIAQYIKNLLEKFNVKKVVYDEYMFHTVKTYLVDIHHIKESRFEAIKQNANTLSQPMDDLISKVWKKLIYFFDNPVTTDHFLNMKPEYNRKGQVYFSKQKQTQRIDIFATVATGMFWIKNIRSINKGKRKLVMNVW